MIIVDSIMKNNNDNTPLRKQQHAAALVLLLNHHLCHENQGPTESKRKAQKFKKYQQNQFTDISHLVLLISCRPKYSTNINPYREENVINSPSLMGKVIELR